MGALGHFCESGTPGGGSSDSDTAAAAAAAVLAVPPPARCQPPAAGAATAAKAATSVTATRQPVSCCVAVCSCVPCMRRCDMCLHVCALYVATAAATLSVDARCATAAPRAVPLTCCLPACLLQQQECVSDAADAMAVVPVVVTVAGAAGTEHGSFGLCVAPSDALLPAVRRRAAALGLRLPAPCWLSLAGKPIGGGVSVLQLGVAPPRSCSSIDSRSSVGVLALQLHGRLRLAGGAACSECSDAWKAAERGHEDCLAARLQAAGADLDGRDQVCGSRTCTGPPLRRQQPPHGTLTAAPSLPPSFTRCCSDVRVCV